MVKERGKKSKSIKIVAVAIIVVMLTAIIAGAWYFTDTTWEEETQFGSWGQQILIEYVDGTGQPLKILANPLTLWYDEQQIASIRYRLSAKARATGYQFCEIDLTSYSINLALSGPDSYQFTVSNFESKDIGADGTWSVLTNTRITADELLPEGEQWSWILDDDIDNIITFTQEQLSFCNSDNPVDVLTSIDPYWTFIFEDVTWLNYWYNQDDPSQNGGTLQHIQPNIPYWITVNSDCTLNIGEMPDGDYTLTITPTGSVRYRGFKTGRIDFSDWLTASLPSPITFGIEKSAYQIFLDFDQDIGIEESEWAWAFVAGHQTQISLSVGALACAGGSAPEIVFASISDKIEVVMQNQYGSWKSWVPTAPHNTMTHILADETLYVSVYENCTLLIDAC